MTQSAEKDAWRSGYVNGFKRGGRAVAESIEGVLDGYDFAGNAFAKAICEEYRDMIRSRLSVALAAEPDTRVTPPEGTSHE